MSIKSEVYLKTQMGELWAAYLLYFLFFTAPIGLIFNLFKIMQYRYLIDHSDIDKDALELIASHHEWLIRTFVITILMVMAAIGTLFFAFGYFIALATVAWWIYRLGRGVMFLIESKATPIAIQ